VPTRIHNSGSYFKTLPKLKNFHRNDKNYVSGLILISYLGIYNFFRSITIIGFSMFLEMELLLRGQQGAGQLATQSTAQIDGQAAGGGGGGGGGGQHGAGQAGTHATEQTAGHGGGGGGGGGAGQQ